MPLWWSFCRLKSLLVFVLCVVQDSRRWWARDREVAREPGSGCRALLPCPMAHAMRHARAVSHARATAARTAKSPRALAQDTGALAGRGSMRARSRRVFLVDRSCSWRRTLGYFRHRPVFRGPYLTSQHDDRTPPHTTLDDATSYGSMTAPAGLSATTGTGTTAAMAAMIPARSHPPPPHTRADGRAGERAGGRAGGRASGRADGRTGGRATTHARAIIRPGRRWDEVYFDHNRNGMVLLCISGKLRTNIAQLREKSRNRR